MKKLQVEVKTKFKNYTDKIYYKDYGVDIIISFKEEGKLFKTKICKEMLFDKNEIDNIDTAIVFLTDKKVREDTVFEIVEEYFKTKRQKRIERKDVELVRDLVSANSKFNFEVEVETYE